MLTESALEPVDLARRRAIALLARREHSTQELQRKLAKLNISSTVVREVLAALKSEGLQSDQRFAGSFVRERVLRGQGPQRIRQELRQRGVPPEMIDVALEEEGGDWQQLAREVLIKKFGPNLPTDTKGRLKSQQFLAYRGFANETIRACLRDEMDE